MTKPQAEVQFREFQLPLIKEREARGTAKVDAALRRTIWNDYTDALCKSGTITQSQYNRWTHPRWLVSARS